MTLMLLNTLVRHPLYNFCVCDLIKVRDLGGRISQKRGVFLIDCIRVHDVNMYS